MAGPGKPRDNRLPSLERARLALLLEGQRRLVEILAQVQLRRCLLKRRLPGIRTQIPPPCPHRGPHAQGRVRRDRLSQTPATFITSPFGATRLMTLAANASSAVK